MRGIEVIILQSRGNPPLSQSTPDKEHSVTRNNCYSKIGALLKSRVLTSTLKPHLSKLWPQEKQCLFQWLFLVVHSTAMCKELAHWEHITAISLHCLLC